MHTLVRDRETASADFVFYADRLLRLVRFCASGCSTGQLDCLLCPCDECAQLHVLFWAC